MFGFRKSRKQGNNYRLFLKQSRLSLSLGILRILTINIFLLAVLCCSAYAANIDATVPASLPITVSSDGTVFTATNATIHNYGSSPIMVSSINVTAQNGWTLTSKDEGISTSIGDKLISMGFNGAWMDSSGVVDTSTFSNIAASDTLDISYDAQIPRTLASEPETTAAIAVFVVKSSSGPVLAPNYTWYKSTEARNKITKITLMDSYTPSDNVDEKWAADADGTGAIACYRTGTELIMAGNGSGSIKANTDSSYLFSYTSVLSRFRGLKEIVNLPLLDTSEVENMSDMFFGCSNIKNLDVSNFDTSNVKNFDGIFRACGLTNLNLSGFNTTNAENMDWMFGGFEGTSLDVSFLDTSNATSMSDMFFGCNNLTRLDVSNFNTSKVTDMSFMFSRCSSLTSLDLSTFDTSNVQTMSSMFSGACGLTQLDLSNFNTSKVTDMSFMFSMALTTPALLSLDISSFDTSNVVNMSSMFMCCDKLTSLDLTHFDTSKVTDMSYMFDQCSLLRSIDLSNFSTGNVTNMSSMFSDCSALNIIYASDKWDTNKVTDSTLMFCECTSLRGDITYNSSYSDKTYAKTKGGYLTYKASTTRKLSLNVDPNTGTVTSYDITNAA